MLNTVINILITFIAIITMLNVVIKVREKNEVKFFFYKFEWKLNIVIVPGIACLLWRTDLI